jgi:hypothetical protein
VDGVGEQGREGRDGKSEHAFSNCAVDAAAALGVIVTRGRRGCQPKAL